MGEPALTCIGTLTAAGSVLMSHKILPEVSPVFQVRSPRHREVKSPAPDHTAQELRLILWWVGTQCRRDRPPLALPGWAEQPRVPGGAPNLPPPAGSPAWVSVAAAHPAIDKGLGLEAEGRRAREAG